MKTINLLLVLMALVCFPIFPQLSVDYSDPKEVAEKFLDYFFKGQLFDAAKYCGAVDCQRQIEILMTKMALDDNYTEEGTCTFTIDSLKIAPDQKTGKCFYTKKCTLIAKPIANHLDLIKVDEKWLVEYIYKRDKYL